MSKLLIIDDDVASCRTLQLHFRSQGHDVQVAHNLEEGLTAARDRIPDVIILDIRMPGRSGLEGLPEFKADFPAVPVIMITAFHDMDTTVQAMKDGADDYIDKPIDINELDLAVTRSLARSRTVGNEMPVNEPGSSKSGSNTMVGRSRAMKEVFKTIGLVAPKLATVLVTGESGTGKELIARAIHQAGKNPSGPFVAVNCAALVDTLLESDLFGHEKGAFTGAVNRQVGKFEIARDGTIFLDEISELSQVIQAKLLRVLQEREFMTLGGSRVEMTNARVIAATNVDLAKRVEEGAFREDLFYRLQVVTIQVPPLRERKDDLDDLVPTLLARINREMHRRISRVAADVIDAFHAYSWPGNVRELENVLMQAAALCPGDTITRDLLASNIAGNEEESPARRDEKPTSERSLDDVQRDHVARVLAATNWHKGRTCEILGISRPRLRRLISQFGLAPENGSVLDTDGAENGSEAP